VPRAARSWHGRRPRATTVVNRATTVGARADSRVGGSARTRLCPGPHGRGTEDDRVPRLSSTVPRLSGLGPTVVSEGRRGHDCAQSRTVVARLTTACHDCRGSDRQSCRGFGADTTVPRAAQSWHGRRPRATTVGARADSRVGGSARTRLCPEPHSRGTEDDRVPRRSGLGPTVVSEVRRGHDCAQSRTVVARLTTACHDCRGSGRQSCRRFGLATLGWSITARACRSCSKRAMTALLSIPGSMILRATRWTLGSRRAVVPRRRSLRGRFGGHVRAGHAAQSIVTRSPAPDASRPAHPCLGRMGVALPNWDPGRLAAGGVGG